MMTSHTIYLLIAFLFGGAVSFIIWGWAYHQHKKAWRLEYRRLMGGIEEVRRRNAIESCFSRQDISNLLTQIKNGDKIWPRK